MMSATLRGVLWVSGIQLNNGNLSSTPIIIPGYFWTVFQDCQYSVVIDIGTGQ
jgi:hypothetical protein